MKGLYEEIQEIPKRATDCLEVSKDLELPKNVPYIGMGSSYYAPLTLLYCNRPIEPYIASEYYYYLTTKKPTGVLISQSGESSETVWNLEKFEGVVSITNEESSSLAVAPNVKQLVQLHSGNESFSSTKSYINTLIALYCGLGIDPTPAVRTLQTRFSQLESLAHADAKKITAYLNSKPVKGLYIIGSGPNHGTALEGALTLSETTKLTWVGMPVAQYDHGPKETANDTVVIVLNARGQDQRRIEAVKANLQDHSNALLIELDEPTMEVLSPIPLIARLNFMMNYLADGLKVDDTFQLGSKVTTVDSSVK